MCPHQPITVPKKNAGGSISICKSSPFGKENYFCFANVKKAVSFVISVSVDIVSNRTIFSSKTLPVIFRRTIEFQIFNKKINF